MPRLSETGRYMRTTISVPISIYRRAQEHRGELNISAVCSLAINNALDALEMGGTKDTKELTVEERLARLETLILGEPQ